MRQHATNMNCRQGNQPSKYTKSSSSATKTENANRYDEDFPPLVAATLNLKKQSKNEKQKTANEIGEIATITFPDSEIHQQQSTKIKTNSWKAFPVETIPIIFTSSSSSPTKTFTMSKYRGTPYNGSKSEQIEEINIELAKIILTIHLRKEYPSVTRIENELFQHYNVQSFQELGVHRQNLDVLMNHIHRDKNVTFYMQVFEQIFNLCTLHDLESLISRFLNLNSYEDAHLGPLDEHPRVKQVFTYNPTQRHQPIPKITSGDVIYTFIEFQYRYPYQRIDYRHFLDVLVQNYGLVRREELGLFCKSFPYLTEVTRKLTWEWNACKRRIESDTSRRIINEVENKLREIQQDVSNQLELSMYTNKSPIAVFDHLASVVDKHLIVPQQKSIRDLLAKIRNDEILRCLLNISIYLGSMDKPNQFLREFQNLTQSQSNRNENSKPTASLNQSFNLNSSFTTNMNQQIAAQNVKSTRNITSLCHEIKPSIPLSNIYSDLFGIFRRYDSILTIKQIYEIKNHLCKKYSVKTFSDFHFNDEDDDDENNYLDIISFIHKYRPQIDPFGHLAIYDYSSSSKNDQKEIYTFVNQLAIVKTWREKQNDNANENENSSNRKILLSKEQSSAIERALVYRFPESLGIGTNQIFQILNKAKLQSTRNVRPMIHYEESLLDEVGLSRLGICSQSVMIDENQLCQIILRCPIMADISTWLQWSNCFQLRYGPLKTYIAGKQQELGSLLLLETSNHELLRLPNEPSFANFEGELNSGNIRLSVGHLCALIICEYGTINCFPMTIYKQAIKTWLIRLRSSKQLDDNNIEPMSYVLEFLTYLPILIGQSRIVYDLLLESIETVFDNDEENLRERIWILANVKQRTKLEVWGHLLDIDEWKNKNKWKGLDEPQEEPIIQFTFEQMKQQQTKTQGNKEITLSQPIEPSVPILNIPSIPFAIENRNPAPEVNGNKNAYEQIKEIRERLGVDNSLDRTGQSIVNHLQGLIERSLEKLSNDLFSEQGHFVLELVQNADDNQYSSDCLPTLRFVISSERILLCNNEIGFQSNHIEAICNVGKSTKGKHKQGYAGHKGIGFKSVFMITDRPEIHSGDYHFCFDTKNGTEQIGYIRPIWLNQSQEDLPSSDQWQTCIRLPIKQEKRTDRLRRNFDDIHAKLLLFLNRLRRIEIIREKDNNQQEMRIFSRIDHAQGQIIELQEKTSTSKDIIKSFWLVVKTAVQLPINIKIQFSDIKCDAESTTISIAYPLDHIHDTSSYEKLPNQPLFAYLPLRSFGFRFILQGDFEVPATREDVLRDNSWNEWLKQEMVRLIPVAYEYFKSLPNILKTCSIDVQNHFGQINLIKAMKFFMKTIPTHNDIDPYFNSFIDKSIQSLMGVIELPVITNETVQWISPTQCVFIRDAFIKQIFTQDLLLSHFNSYYLSEEFVNECDPSILIKLGCRKLDFTNILRLIRSLYTQTEQEHTTKTTSIEQIAQWFLCIDYSLQQEREKPGFTFDDNNQTEETTIEQLKQLKIIPLHGQSQLVSIEQFKDRAILFPLDKSTPYPKYIRLVYEDLPTIDERLLDYIEKKYPHRFESIKSLLKDLGIAYARNVRKIYFNHIFPILSENSQWSNKPDSILIAYVIFIYKNLYFDKPDHFRSEMNKLKDILFIKIRQGRFIRISSNIIHLTQTYGCKMSLDLLKLPTEQFIFISDDYYKQYYDELFCKASERNQFINFLNELGIYDFFLVKKTELKFTKVEQLRKTKWNHIIEQLSSLVFEPFTIQDSSCEEFDRLISTKENAGADQYSKILLYLEHCFQWTSHYFLSTIIRTSDLYTGNPTPILGVESSFCLLLRRNSWIPVIGGQFHKPTDVYCLPLNDPFSRYVPCLDQSKVALKNQDFIKLLGFKLEISSKTMFELFMKWSCDLDRDTLWDLIQNQTSHIIPCEISPTTHRSCHDTINNIGQIYMRLVTDQETVDLLSRFRQWPVIFIPRTADIGEFLFTNELFWHDPESLLTFGHTIHYQSTQRISLKTYYGSNNSFFQYLFVRVFQVKERPTLEDYLPLLNNLTDKNIEYIWKCIRVITCLAFTDNKQKLVKDQCQNWPFIPCISYTHRLVKCTDQPYYPDDTIIADLFADIIPIIRLSNDLKHSNTFKQQFCSLFDIEDLGNVIQNVIYVENEQESEELHTFYSSSIDLIQSFLFINRTLSESRSNHLQSIFSEMKFISVDSICLSYRYKQHPPRKPTSSSILDSYIDESTRKFYILKKYEKSESRYIHTMINYLVQDQNFRLQLSYYIQYLLKIYQDEGLDGLNKVRQHLPEHSLSKWIIPQIIKKELSISSSDEDENEVSDEFVTVPKELLEDMLNEPDWRSLKPNANKPIDPNQPKTLTCFPAKASMGVLTESLNATKQPASVPKTTDTTLQTSTHNDTHTVRSTVNNQSNAKNNAEQIESKSNKQSLNVTHQLKTDANNQSAKPQTGTPVIPARINYDKIRIVSLIDMSVSSETNPNPPTTANIVSTINEAEITIGRRGEELVYKYLRWKNPDRTIEWINENRESGQPFDIRIIHKEMKNQIDLIEVKTTRSSTQNTFQISIGEIECLLANQNNYHIYRVYYNSNDELSSTIAIISQVKCNLQQKQLALSMTIPSSIHEQ